MNFIFIQEVWRPAIQYEDFFIFLNSSGKMSELELKAYSAHFHISPT
jgi:hypothetical protein